MTNSNVRAGPSGCPGSHPRSVPWGSAARIRLFEVATDAFDVHVGRDVNAVGRRISLAAGNGTYFLSCRYQSLAQGGHGVYLFDLAGFGKWRCAAGLLASSTSVGAMGTIKALSRRGRM
jgi:hypothetical protein